MGKDSESAVNVAAGGTASVRILRLDSLTLTYRASTKDEDALRRRFMMLAVPAGAAGGLRGGVGYVVKAESVGAQGEYFALKRLKFPTAGAAAANDPQAAQLAASFQQEYDVHRVLSPTGLVPKLYGYARVAGEPAILMEWVEGVTLRAAARELRGADGRVPLETVADIGLSVLAALRRIELVDEGLVHRDLSPANIMIRTDKSSLEDQVRAGIFDICLIDFGSATMEQETISSFTVAENFWRGATPGYAPPEMLDRQSGDSAEKRRSHAIDVYALCSVLYELYAGELPYETARRAEHAIYEMKTTEPPRSLRARTGDDGGLRDAILQGLAADQGKRPSIERLADEFETWEEERGASRPWARTLDALVESDSAATAASKTSSSLSPTVLEMSSAPMAGSGSGPAGPAARPGFRKRHPRLAVRLAVAVAAVVAVVVAGSLTRWFGLLGPEVRGSVNDYSWSELSQISRKISDAEDGAAAQQVEAEYHLVNGEGKLDGTQVKDVTLSDGTRTQVEITGFRHDERSDGSGKAGISFSFTSPVGEQPMDAGKQKTRAWSETSLRTWLADDFARELPDDLASSIVPVQKSSIVLAPASDTGGSQVQGIDDDGNDLRFSVSLETTDDRLWLYADAEVRGLSDAEMLGALGMSAAEGNALQYELFANTTSATAFEQSQTDGNTQAFATASWLRTPDQNNRHGFENMESDGSGDDAKGANPAERLGVVPGFCV